MNWWAFIYTFFNSFDHIVCAFIQGTAIRDRIQEQLKRQRLRGLLGDTEDDDDEDYFYDDSTEEEEYYDNEDEQ